MRVPSSQKICDEFVEQNIPPSLKDRLPQCSYEQETYKFGKSIVYVQELLHFKRINKTCIFGHLKRIRTAAT